MKSTCGDRSDLCDEVLRSRMARLAPREYGGKAKEKEYERTVLLFLWEIIC